MVNCRAGKSSLGCLIMLLLLAGAGYFGFNVGEAYFRYYRFRDAMNQQAIFAAHESDAQIQRELSFFADSIGLPEDAKAVDVSRQNGVIDISADYTETVEFPYYVRHIHFTPSVESRF